MRRILILLLPAALFAAEARYARLGQFEGQAEVQLTAASDWMAAERNLPLPESAWLRTGESSRVEIELDEGSAWRLGPGSQAEVSDYSRLSTGQRVTLLTLDRGLAYFTGQPEGKDALTLAVPGAQITVSQRARLRLEVQESWSRISVLEGVVRFSSPAAEIDLREGQTTRVEPANPARFFLNREIASLDLDRWSEVRDKTLASTPSAAHVIERYGLADLDTAGKWIQTADLGAVWKPEVADGWLPFQNGRWRWYDAVGYTWISADPWGWLPYHYGRWAHREDLGWVWAPAKNAIFKPGEVYWLRGTRLVGWGPLAPGETWKGPGSDAPRQFLNVYTTFAAFWQDAAVIDPAGFTARPDEPLVVASFALALPSPAFVAARLDATRPLLVTRTRVAPVVEEAAFQSSPGPTIMVVNPPPPPPVVVITEPPPEPQQPAAPVAYPVPVYTGMVVMNPPQPATAPAPQTAVAKATAPPPPAVPRGRPSKTASPGAKPIEPQPPGRRFRSGESEIAAAVAGDIAGNNFTKALEDLDRWTERYPRTDFLADRVYYYIVAYNGARQSAKVVDTARQLLPGGELALNDQRQMLLALYLTSVNAQKLPRPTRDQLAAGELAARTLLDSVPAYFTPRNKPPETTDDEWMKARADLEAAAKTTLAMHSTHR